MIIRKPEKNGKSAGFCNCGSCSGSHSDKNVLQPTRLQPKQQKLGIK